MDCTSSGFCGTSGGGSRRIICLRLDLDRVQKERQSLGLAKFAGSSGCSDHSAPLVCYIQKMASKVDYAACGCSANPRSIGSGRIYPQLDLDRIRRQYLLGLAESTACSIHIACYDCLA